MEDDDCYGFGSYDDVFSAPPGAQGQEAAPEEITSALTPRSRKLVDVTSPVSAAAIGTYLMDAGYFVASSAIATPRFHGHHIGLKIKRNGKLVAFSFPDAGDMVAASVVEAGAAVSVLGELFLDDTTLLWKPAHYADAKASASGHMYGSDRYSLQLPRGHVRGAQSARVQNVMSALVVTIETFDIAFEFTFMPGPYSKPSKCNELLDLLTPTASSPQAAPLATPSKKASPLLSQTPPMRTPQRRLSSARSPVPMWSSPHHLSRDAVDERNALVRAYLALPRGSAEALDAAATIQDKYGYPIGPVAGASFLDDKDYRRDTVARLAETVERMKRVWKAEEVLLEQQTHVRSSRSGDHDITYLDTNTSHFITPKEYEVRYKQQIQASTPVVLTSSSLAVHPPTLLDASASCIVDAQFFERETPLLTLPETVPSALMDEATSKLRGYEARIDCATNELYQAIAKLTHQHYTTVRSIEDEYAQYISSLGVQLPVRLDASRPPNKRRRRSILTSPSQGESISDPQATSDLEAAQDEESAKRQRRLSTDLPTMAELDDAAESSNVVAAPSPLCLEEDADLNLCNLCFDERVAIVLKPCGHEMCNQCWGKLQASHVHESGAIQCPWDRETVEPQVVVAP
ncbi:hypothetical protein SDRG_09156 [Saprolegnia diclina VS20]|uniref:RING-type domain-containing protein n=1 Tax=Saprolegnia diclina (strain VS20) TaxID=1156394 RepID=T0QHK8_SAPDV|nr:hypothetical protein SDRG_09156 [Saprolegnia diclina VS20]EQC33170.1 hypothetical protein SDRG_09156 [Saprolegnia diclina VS20]|eukprot:XP_008613293.1 hypothetical protein SDRG_09156 [Saprolegnia diclina VS20]